jgi:hypothetical protein
MKEVEKIEMKKKKNIVNLKRKEVKERRREKKIKR